ncbi:MULTISPECIES: acyl carrier protein [Streptomyces]|jgi:acyl carrier protein|uniref:Acyl carrier protein n=1 Tax=Streptomyces nymphaeiformis TaxID=2663842 RepID=A0A7W7XH01_9ACTN|nr:acyl carrier protein [Streptomyces nymphaeiformis]MBB4987031.1 acyl carrier protein [Streptomyces nymphaeiformis]
MTHRTWHGRHLVLTALDGTEYELHAWLGERLQAGAPPGIRGDDAGRPLLDFGMDSVRLLGLIGTLDEVFGLELEPDEIYASETVGGLAAHLADRATAAGRGGRATS